MALPCLIQVERVSNAGTAWTTIKNAESKPVLILAFYLTFFLLRNSIPVFCQVNHLTSIHEAKAEKPAYE